MQENLTFIENIAKGFEAIKRIAEIEYEYNSRKKVYQHDKVILYHYQPKVKKPHTVPLLVVFATVNRPEVLDLFPEHSFIRGLLDQGLDVYLLDWGYPDINDKHISMSDYVTDYLQHCIKFIIQHSKKKKIDLLGVCQGGLLCLCYAALYKSIKNLILISAPVDFHTEDNTITKFVKNIDIDTFVKLTGNIPGAWLTQFFITLRPFELVGKKYLRFIDNVSDVTLTNKFLRVEKWLNDAPDQTGVSFSEFIKDYYVENKLIKNKITMNNKKVNLKNVTIPILNVMAKEDEIIPPSASRPLKKYVGSTDYTECEFPSGHIGIYVSDKVGARMSTEIAAWVKKHQK